MSSAWVGTLLRVASFYLQHTRARHRLRSIRADADPWDCGPRPTWSQAVSPAIDWDVTITLTRNSASGTTSYQITGAHDGFPFHVIHIGASQVMQRDPIPNGDAPLALFGSGDVDVSVGGTL